MITPTTMITPITLITTIKKTPPVWEAFLFVAILLADFNSCTTVELER